MTKQSMKQNWKSVKLGEVALFKNGKSRPSSKGKFPVYGGNGILDFASEFNSEGEVVVVGRVGAYCGSVYFDDKPLWVSDNAMFALPKEGSNARFLYYLLKHINLNKYAQGSSHPLLTQTLLNDIGIAVPDLPTQTRIASILSSLDNKIELNLRMNQTLEAMAQAIFKEWFVEFRFPGFDGSLERGIPTGWKYKKLNEFGKVITGNTPSSKNPEQFGDSIPFVTPSDFKSYNKIVTEADRYLSNDGKLALSTRLIPKDSVLVTCIGSDMGKVAINKVECVTNQQINSIIPFESNRADFLYNYLILKYDYLRNIASGGSTMLIINKSQFESIEILAPEAKLMDLYHEVVHALCDKVEINTRQIKTLTRLRDGLLPQLMSGKIEVN